MAKDRVEILVVPLDNYNPATPIVGQNRAIHISVTNKFFRNLERRKNGHGNGFSHEVVFMHPEIFSQATKSPRGDFSLYLRKEELIIRDDTAFSGNFRILNVAEKEKLADFASGGVIAFEEVFPGANPNFLTANECCILKDSSEAEAYFELAVYKAQADAFVRVTKPYKVEGKISPFTTELAFARYLLFDNSVGAVVITGPAGTGKSTMAIHAAVEQLLDGRFSSIEIIKSTHQTGGQPSFAAFPGNRDQKFAEHRRPVETTLLKVLADLSVKVKARQIGKQTADQRKDGKKGGVSENLFGGLPIHIIPPNHLRGEEFQNKCVILEEAQNFGPDTILLAGTRIGPGSRLFIVGDIRQIDIPGHDDRRSGLAEMIQKLTDHNLFGKVGLTKCLRQGVAQMFVEACY